MPSLLMSPQLSDGRHSRLKMTLAETALTAAEAPSASACDSGRVTVTTSSATGIIASAGTPSSAPCQTYTKLSYGSTMLDGVPMAVVPGSPMTRAV